MWIMPERIPDHVAEPCWPLSWWGQRRGTSHWGGTDPLHLLLLSHHAPLSSCSGSLPLMLLHAQRPVIHAVYYTLSEHRGPATISHQLSVPAPSSSHHHSTAASWWRLKPETKVKHQTLEVSAWKLIYKITANWQHFTFSTFYFATLFQIVSD